MGINLRPVYYITIYRLWKDVEIFEGNIKRV